jgi:hypothetical protein
MAPLGGINDTQPLAAMEPNYCLDMVNWYPGNSALAARRGYKEWATGFGAPVKTIMTYYDMSGVVKLFAATDAGIYDISVSTDSPVVELVAVNGDFKYVMFGTVNKQYLVAVNAKGAPSFIYDGTTWVAMVEEAGTPDAPGEIKGVNPSTFSHVTTFKRRLWFVEDDTTTAWYLPIDSVGGEAKPFYLGSIFRRGGKLLYIVDWSVDAGDGLDNKIVFVSDVGEIAIYAGDDPDSTDPTLVDRPWHLESVFYSASPMGERTAVDVGGDVLFLTAFGVIPLSRILLGEVAQSPDEASISKNINRALNRIAASKLYQINWQIYNIQNSQSLMVNIPPNGNSPAIQYVMNLLTGAWTRYDLPINCATIARGTMYFGTTDGRVCEFGEENYLDDVALDGTGGVKIVCGLFTAFSYMDNPSVLKHWNMMRLLFQATRPPNYVFRLNTDFSLDSLAGVPAPPPELDVAPSLWDSALWNQSTWSSTDTVYRPWLGVSAMGFSCALLLNASVVAKTQLTSIDFVYEEGGFI